jgi:hypothetical protein
VVVVGTGQQRGELRPLDLAFESIEAGGELGGELAIVLLLQELVGGFEVTDRDLEAVVPIDAVLQPGEALGQLLTMRRVVPDRRVGGLSFGLRELPASVVDVKGTPSRRRSCRGARGVDRSARSWRPIVARPIRDRPSPGRRVERHVDPVRASTDPGLPGP